MLNGMKKIFQSLCNLPSACASLRCGLPCPITVVLVLNAGLSAILEPISDQDLSHLRAAPVIEPTEKISAISATGKDVSGVPTAPGTSIRLDANTVLDAIAAELQGHYQVLGELRVSAQREWRPVKLNSNNWHLNITQHPLNGLQSSVLLKFEIIEDDRVIGQWQLPVRCELWQSVLKSTRRIVNGVEPLASDFLVRKADVLRLADRPVPVDLDLDQYVIKQSIPDSSVLLWQNVEEKPLIRKGQVVDVVASEGIMLISMKGVALEDGLLNDFISIRNLTSKKSIEAQVIDENHVKVHF